MKRWREHSCSRVLDLSARMPIPLLRIVSRDAKSSPRHSYL
ncbi:MAG TPA: hypothetical protein PLW02_07390 [Verrucomicrobiota bacterium]|nr:hypothetical protein [Verrucomicrobiota bacterium]